MIIEALPKCRDGYDRNHNFAIPKYRYRFWKMFALFFGVSVKPYKISYECLVCKEIFDETIDPEILEKHY